MRVEVRDDLDHIEGPPREDGMARGIGLFVAGLVKKAVIADSIAGWIDPMLGAYGSLSTLGAWTAERDAWEAAAALQRAGVAASPVEDLHDLLHRDEAMMADYQEVGLPSGVTAIVQHQPIAWDGERLPIVRAPLWGEHTDEVLRGELGLGDAEIATLAERNVLF